MSDVFEKTVNIPGVVDITAAQTLSKELMSKEPKLADAIIAAFPDWKISRITQVEPRMTEEGIVAITSYLDDQENHHRECLHDFQLVNRIPQNILEIIIEMSKNNPNNYIVYDID